MASIHEVNNHLSNYVATRVAEAREDALADCPDWVWVANEITHWKQRCEELEIELAVIRNAFPEHSNDIIPKQRGIF